MKRLTLCYLFCFLPLLCLGQTTLRQSTEGEAWFHQADSLEALREYDNAAECAALAAENYALEFGRESMEYGVALGRMGPYLVASDYRWQKPLESAMNIIMAAKGVECDEYAQVLTTYAHWEYHDSILKMDYAQLAVDIRKKVLGTHHPDYAHSLTVLAECYEDGEHFDEAISLLREAVNILRGHESTHAKVLGSALNDLVSIYRRCERYHEAIACLEELLDLKTSVLGREDKSTIKTMRNLASYYRHVGEELKAYQLQNEVNQLTSQAEIGSSDLFYVEPLSELAYTYEARGRFDLAIPLCERIVDIYKKNAQEPGHEPSFVDSMYIAHAATRLAKCCLEGRYYAKAMDAATEACNIWDSYNLNKDTVYVEKPEALRRDIFFTINKWDIRPSEQQKVADIANYLQRYPNAKVSLCGYADVQTGNDRINDNLGVQRVNAVKQELISKYGIAEYRISTDSKGARVQPFSVNEQNRVTIAIAE